MRTSGFEAGVPASGDAGADGAGGFGDGAAGVVVAGVGEGEEAAHGGEVLVMHAGEEGLLLGCEIGYGFCCWHRG